MNYEKFLDSKALTFQAESIKRKYEPHEKLFDFQRDILDLSLERGRSAIFADCGFGKSFMQLEWARQIDGNVLILAPLAVTSQTVREGNKFGIEVNHIRSMADFKPGINITNYEKLELVMPEAFTGIILDESSILKSFDGKTRNKLIESFSKTPFRLACTATPSPNDFMELGNHSEFLGIMDYDEMLAMFFTHDGGETQKWRLKGHAEDDFWKWLCSWSVSIRKPSDLGYDDGDFKLPPLKMHEHIVSSKNYQSDNLFELPAATLQERIAARRLSVEARAAICADLVNSQKYQWIVWCNLNKESDSLANLIPDSIEVKGSDSEEKKEKAVIDFIDGTARVLISKPSMFGHGLNLQNCSNMAFVGLTDSYEEFYQAVRRCWRFGQTKEVNAHLISAESEGAVLQNIKRKEENAVLMAEKMAQNMRDITIESLKKKTGRQKMAYKIRHEKNKNFDLRLGDCVEESKKIESNSIHYSIFSPPFASLYVYSNSDRDMGNCKDHNEFMIHFDFMVKELYRILIPGRLVSFHCMNLPTSKARDGVIGITDFRGKLIDLFQRNGFIYHSEVCIWKDPVTAMQRTKALGLLHKQLKKDSCMSRQGIPDYLVTMRKLGENPERVSHTNESFPVQVWQKYASPVWMDINPSDTLQFRMARENNDERHICPLQLEVIQRAIELWTNPGDLVFSPFAGIGSEGYQAIKMGRKFLGIELKESYFNVALKNLQAAEIEQNQDLLISVE